MKNLKSYSRGQSMQSKLSHTEIKKRNYASMDMLCEKCGKTFGIDHPTNEFVPNLNPYDYKGEWAGKDKCRKYEPYSWGRPLREDTPPYNHFKIRRKWYKVTTKVKEIFLSTFLVDEFLEIQGAMYKPNPQTVRIQKDVFLLAEKLGVEPALSKRQKKGAKTRVFVDRVKRT